MHRSVMQWVAFEAEERGLLDKDVLEVGSYNVNGTVRPFFSEGSYVGVDMRKGPGVDVVAVANALPFRPASFDVVLCLEMLEHDPQPWDSFPEMARVLKYGGTMLLSTRGIGFPLHDHPSDYWRFTQDGIKQLAYVAQLNVVSIKDDPLPGHPGVMAVMTK